jgi:hypothetical protein
MRTITKKMARILGRTIVATTCVLAAGVAATGTADSARAASRVAMLNGLALRLLRGSPLPGLALNME